MNLPAPNMQKMADGGIIAFAGGGDTDGVAHFDSGDLVKQEERDREDFLYGLRRTGAAAKDVFSMPVRGVAGAAESIITRPLRAAGVPIPYLPDDFYGGDRTSPTPYMDAIRREEAAKSPTAPAAPAAPAVATTTPPAQTQFVDARNQATKTPPVAEKKKDVGIGNIPKPTAGTSMSYEDTLKKVGAADKELLGQYEKLGKEETTGMEALLAEREKNKPGGKAGESLEKYLKGKEAADVNKRAENINNAFVNAGFAMAAGDSPSILQNLAKGGKEGMASYKAGLEKLDAAADERAKMFAGIEDARRAEAKGDWKELYAAKTEIKKSESAYKKYGIDALVKLTGENRKVAADIFTNDQTNQRALQQAHISGQYDLQGRKIMASAYGNSAKLNPANIATDNAAKALETWKGSQEGKLAQARDPSAYAKKERELLTQHFMMQGLPNPFVTSDKNLFKDPKEQAAYEAFAGG
jgi:hypothetical protein